MTKVVGTLEDRGLVTRVTDPDDRRVARLTLTPAGAETLRRSRSMRTAFLADRAALADLTDLLERLVDMDDG